MSPDLFSVVFFEFAKVAAPILAGAISAYVIRFLKTHLSAAQIAEGERIAVIVVKAAEQIGVRDGLLSSQKFQLALDQALDLADKAGVRLSIEQWTSLIEAAVAALRAAGDELRRPTPNY